MTERIVFIGGGNMASAIIGGLIRQGHPPGHIDVIEPMDEARSKLSTTLGVAVHAQADAFLANAAQFVWAIKPQVFAQAAATVAPYASHALHLSVAAGIPSGSIAQWLGCERIVRSMPNTPALVGKGITGLFARSAVTLADKLAVENLIATTGEFLWLSDESQLDVVTALSGSGPAYVFYFMEAMTTAGTEMGLPRAQAYKLAQATFAGATALAQASSESPQVLRQRVTSKGGTTHAAISAMENDDVRALFINAMYAARQRAHELGIEFGAQ